MLVEALPLGKKHSEEEIRAVLETLGHKKTLFFDPINAGYSAKKEEWYHYVFNKVPETDKYDIIYAPKPRE